MAKLYPKRHPDNRNLFFHYDPTFRGCEVNGDESMPLIENYLARTHNLLAQVRGQQSRTLAIRFDLYIPQPIDPPGLAQSNQLLTNFWRLLKREIDNAHLHHPANLEYIWTRETGYYSNKSHFHVLLLINGHAIYQLGNPMASFDGSYSDATLAHRIIRAWLQALDVPPSRNQGSLVNFTQDPSNAFFCRLLHRDEEAAWAHLFYVATYLCKANTKPIGASFHVFGTSRPS